MADKKITDLDELTAVASDDYLEIVDTSTSTSKKISQANLINAPVFLTTPLTSTSWDGDAFSNTSKTLIDLSSVFGVPAGVKAVLVKVALRDSASASGLYYIQFSGVSSGTNYSIVVEAPPVNDRFGYGQGIVPCNANGDIYYNIIASGSGTMDIYLEIWGYWL